MPKIENEEVRSYLIDFATTKLEKSRLFTRVFGKKFVRNRLNKNLGKVYTNEISKTMEGYYHGDDNSITICSSGKNETPLTKEDIENNEEVKHTILHESVHAILKKSKKECKELSIKYSTGILEQYKNGNELGRGLNEGLTNWICEKVGIDSGNSYIEETNFAKQLELALGPRKVMQICKGDIQGNVVKQLGTTNRKCKKLLAAADSVYSYGQTINEINIIIDVLNQYLDMEQVNYSNQEIAKRKTAYEDLNNMSTYANLEENEEYKEFLKRKFKTDSINTRLDFFKDEKEEFGMYLEQSRAEFESIVFEKYFQTEFNKLMEMDHIQHSDYQKYAKLSKLMLKSQSDYILGSSIDFQNQFKDMKQKYFEGIYLQAENEYKNGTLSIKELHRLENSMDIGDNIEKYGKMELINRISKLISTQNSESVSYLIDRLDKRGELKNINDYSILQLKANNKNINLFKQNGEIQFERDLDTKKQIEASQELNQNNIFDFTMGIDEDIQNVVKQFIQIKTAVQNINPNAKFTIVSRTIELDNNGKKLFFFIDDGNIVPADIISEEQIQANFAQTNQLPSIRRESIWQKLLSKIKKQYIVENIKGENRKISENKTNIFRKGISDMTNYGRVAGENVNLKDDNQQNEQQNNLKQGR